LNPWLSAKSRPNASALQMLEAKRDFLWPTTCKDFRAEYLNNSKIIQATVESDATPNG
jgi:hypothetical protein